LRAFVAVAALAAVSLFSDAATAQPPQLEVQGVAPTGSMPKGVSLSPDGTRAYVTNFGMSNGHNIEVVDATTLAHIDSIDLPGNVVESVLSPDGSTIFASNFIRNSVQFVDVKTKRVTKEITTGTHPKILVLSPDGKQLFAANWSGDSVTQIDVPSAKVVRTLPAGKNPRGMVMTKSGTLYVANFNGESIDVFKGPDFADRHRFKACPIPRHLTLTIDEKLLIVSCYHDSMVHAIDVTTEKVVHELQTNSVSVIDTEDWTARVFRVPGMDHGSGLTIYPDGKHALVTGWYDNHVYMVGFEGSGGDPGGARAKIDGWIRRPKHD
jgi:YVTN family beta-propeller protein